MKNTDFLKPDYYDSFSCKMGKCRSSCCEGWPVSISQEEYFKLLSLKCSKKLRSELDCSLHIQENATSDSYATLEHKWDGNCHMRLADGRCAIHSSKGEDSLPLVCKRYPRSIIEGDFPECCCSNSCERTIEILAHHNGSLRFDCPKGYELSKDQQLRLFLIGLVQDRNYTIPGRFYNLGLAIQELDRAKKAGENFEKEKALEIISKARIRVSSKEVFKQLATGLEIITQLIQKYDGKSRSLSEYGEIVLRQANKDGDICKNYLEAKTIFESLFPYWESAFENIIVNHMFFSGFPCQKDGICIEEEYGSLCAMYGMMRVLCLGWVANNPEEEKLVDLMAKIFRFIDHTSFHKNTGLILMEKGIVNLDQFFTLANI